MPLPVVGSLSEAEAVGLGKVPQEQSGRQNGILFRCADMVTNDKNDTVAGYMKSLFVPKSGAETTGNQTKLYTYVLA